MERDNFHVLKGLIERYFNSHAHVERDIQYLKSVKSFMYFNSHAHVERDLLQLQRCNLQKIFQLTRSRGA